MERRTRQRQGARWQTKEKRERRGAQRAQGEEGGKGRRQAGGTRARLGKANSKEAKRGNGPLERTLAGKSVFPGSSALRGNWELQGRAATFLPSSTRAGWGWGFFFVCQLKFGHCWCRRRKIKIPLGFIPPRQAGQLNAAELKQLGKGFLSWNRDSFGGPTPRGRGGASGGSEVGLPARLVPAASGASLVSRKRFGREKKYRQDGQQEGSLPHLSATAPEHAMPPAGRGGGGKC